MSTEIRENSAGTLRLLAGTAGVIFCHFIALAVLGMVLCRAVPYCEAFCKEWNLLLPRVTFFAIDVSHWMMSYWYLLVLGLVPDAIVYFLLARLRPSLNWFAALWAFVPLVCAIVLLGVVTVGMCLPLRQVSPNQQGAAAMAPRS